MLEDIQDVERLVIVRDLPREVDMEFPVYLNGLRLRLDSRMLELMLNLVSLRFIQRNWRIIRLLLVLLYVSLLIR